MSIYNLSSEMPTGARFEQDEKLLVYLQKLSESEKARLAESVIDEVTMSSYKCKKGSSEFQAVKKDGASEKLTGTNVKIENATRPSKQIVSEAMQPKLSPNPESPSARDSTVAANFKKIMVELMNPYQLYIAKYSDVCGMKDANQAKSSSQPRSTDASTPVDTDASTETWKSLHRAKDGTCNANEACDIDESELLRLVNPKQMLSASYSAVRATAASENEAAVAKCDEMTKRRSPSHMLDLLSIGEILSCDRKSNLLRGASEGKSNPASPPQNSYSGRPTLQSSLSARNFVDSERCSI